MDGIPFKQTYLVNSYNYEKHKLKTSLFTLQKGNSPQLKEVSINLFKL